MYIKMSSSYAMKKSFITTFSVIIPSFLAYFLTKEFFPAVVVCIINLQVGLILFYENSAGVKRHILSNGSFIIILSALSCLIGQYHLISVTSIITATFLAFYYNNFPNIVRGVSLKYGVVDFVIFCYKYNSIRHEFWPLIIWGFFGVFLYYVIVCYLFPERHFYYKKNITPRLLKGINQYIKIICNIMNKKSEHQIKIAEKLYSQYRILKSNYDQIGIEDKIAKINADKMELHHRVFITLYSIHQKIAYESKKEKLPENFVKNVTNYLILYMKKVDSNNLTSQDDLVSILNFLKLESISNIEAQKVLYLITSLPSLKDFFCYFEEMNKEVCCAK